MGNMKFDNRMTNNNDTYGDLIHGDVFLFEFDVYMKVALNAVNLKRGVAIKLDGGWLINDFENGDPVIRLEAMLTYTNV